MSGPETLLEAETGGWIFQYTTDGSSYLLVATRWERARRCVSSKIEHDCRRWWVVVEWWMMRQSLVVCGKCSCIERLGFTVGGRNGPAREGRQAVNFSNKYASSLNFQSVPSCVWNS